MGCLVRLSLAVLIVLSTCFVTNCEEGSCSRDGQDCGEEEKSFMVKTEDKVEELGDLGENILEDEGIVEENENLKDEKRETMYDNEEEVDGMFEPCVKTEYGGQLHKMMILQAGYKLTEDSKIIRVHCQPESDEFFANGYYQTTGYVDDEEVLIVAMLPSQGLQPHAHDLVEDITLGYGELAYFTWLDGPGIPSNRTILAGSPVGVGSGVTHAVFAGPEGAVYHEPLHRENAARKAWFAPN
eukprot:GFUD01009185.1.p1 GENE.GFUD01009185.1~~GFUD01009185.1.p1  ORF type:complete len:241 (-),score=89.30 GFUD01009185.1:333-1055(-)